VIKYLGSKRRLVPLLTSLAEVAGGSTALDLFTGTTRVAQALRRAGFAVTAVDTARYAEVLARTYVVWAPGPAEIEAAAEALGALAALPPEPGYVTETFCLASRYFHPQNGARIDAVRATIDRHHRGTPLEPVLLTSLLEAADRVDSTTGVQMAYLKNWAPRASQPLDLRLPQVPAGPPGRAVRADAVQAASAAGTVDLAYLDPPYNQHRYFTNYHVWETLVAWDHPDHYGVACKRTDARDEATRSVFNDRRRMPEALRTCLEDVDARVVVLSYNDEAWLALDDLVAMVAPRGEVVVLAVDSRRYVGAQIGIHNPKGKKVGAISHLRNTEYVVVAGRLRPGEADAIATAGASHGASVAFASGHVLTP
jgi:adenine-specific DNA-methyltransferase